MIEYSYGKNTVLQRLKQGKPIETIYLVSAHQEIEQLAKRQKVRVEKIDGALANKMVKGNHQGVIARVKAYETKTLDQLLNKLDMSKNPILVMCDHLEDPHNLGAILRTCDAVGVDGVIINKDRSVTLNATVAKVSTGAIDTVDVEVETNLVNSVKKLKQHGFWIVAADNAESIDYRQVPHDRPLVVIVGSEGKGVSQLLKKESDYRVAIFMLGKINSLNVSVACGVMLYSIVEKRVPIQ